MVFCFTGTGNMNEQISKDKHVEKCHHRQEPDGVDRSTHWEPIVPGTAAYKAGK